LTVSTLKNESVRQRVSKVWNESNGPRVPDIANESTCRTVSLSELSSCSLSGGFHLEGAVGVCEARGDPVLEELNI